MENAVAAITLRPIWNNGSETATVRPPENQVASCSIEARTDIHAAAEWVQSYAGRSPETHRAARKEAERLLLWCQWIGKRFGELKLADVQAYWAFVADPQPAELWVSDTRWARSDARWRPFVGVRRYSSQVQALVQAKVLFSWLQDAGYIQANPFRLFKVPRQSKDDLRNAPERLLQPTDLAYLRAGIETLPVGSAHQRRMKARTKFTLDLLLTSGLRISEAADVRVSDIRVGRKFRIWLHVVGKGNKPRKVPVPPELIDAYRAYRQAVGLTPHAVDTEKANGLLKGNAGTLSADTVYLDVGRVLAAAANLALEAGDQTAHDRLSVATPHWLRHTRASRWLEEGVPLAHVRDNLGHASLATTSRYVHTDDDARYESTTRAAS